MKPVSLAALLFCISTATAGQAPGSAGRLKAGTSPAPLATPPAAAPGNASAPPPSAPAAGAAVPAPAAAKAETALPPPSSTAQKLYASARPDLLQIRMVLRNGRSQSSVGSGFLVGRSNLALTNYHVVSELALDPDVYAGEYVDTDGKSGPVTLLAVDVLHDLAVVRIGRSGSGSFRVPQHPLELAQGARLYSLGNPLDLGFAISEGAYNGVITRSFYDQLMFTGPINAGMSGGPSVTEDGIVAGVNVSKRTDGELVSFLVPVKYAQELLRKVAAQAAPPRDFRPLIGQQLLAHQAGMVDRLLDKPLSLKTMGPYAVPVRESQQVRCWGRSNAKSEAQYSIDTMNCSMESAVFVSDSQQTGYVSMVHQYLRSTSMPPLRFATLASRMFAVSSLGGPRDTRLTVPACTEQFVRTSTLPLRAVTCVRAYRKFAGLYDFTLLTASTDSARASLQSRLDLSGVSWDNGMRVTRTFLAALGRGGRR